MKRFLMALLIVAVWIAPAHAAYLTLKKGTTSKTLLIPIYDSSSTTGGVLTGLAYNTSGLAANYTREGAAGNSVPVTLATATKGTWASGGFVLADGSSMTGVYEFGIPDAALATGANSVAVKLSGAANMVPVNLLIQLDDNTPADVYTRLGAPAGASAAADIAAIKSDSGAVKTQTDKLAFTVANKVDANVYTWNGTAVSAPSTAGIPEVNIKNIANAAVSTSTAQIGVNAVQIGAAVPGSATIGTVTTATTCTNLTNAPTNGDLTATMKTSVTTAATAATPALSAAGNTAIWSVALSAYSGDKAGTYVKGIFDKLPTNYLMGSAVVTAKDDEIDAIKTKTDYLPSATAGAAGGVFIAGSNAATSITTALTANITGNLSGSVGSVTNDVGITQAGADKAWGTASRVLTAGTNIALAKGTGVTGFNDLDAAGVAGAVWNAATASYGTAGTYGLLMETDLDATISSRGTSTLTAANVWDTNLAGYSTASLAGTLLKGAGSAGDPWSTAIPGAYGAGTAGKIIGDNLNATVSSRSSHSAADVATAILVTPANKLATDASNRVTVGSNADKTGYTASTVSDKTGYTCSTVSDKTGYSLSQTFPTNFSSMAITAGGAVTAGTVSDKTGYSILAGDKDTLVDLIWNELQSGHTNAGTFGKYLDAQVSTVGGSLTAADIWAYSSRTLTGAGSADWTAGERANILAALGITDGAPTVTLDTLYQAIRVHR